VVDVLLDVVVDVEVVVVDVEVVVVDDEVDVEVDVEVVVVEVEVDVVVDVEVVVVDVDVDVLVEVVVGSVYVITSSGLSAAAERLLNSCMSSASVSILSRNPLFVKLPPESIS
jgi:hypothetical protein